MLVDFGLTAINSIVFIAPESVQRHSLVADGLVAPDFLAAVQCGQLVLDEGSVASYAVGQFARLISVVQGKFDATIGHCADIGNG